MGQPRGLGSESQRFQRKHGVDDSNPRLYNIYHSNGTMKNFQQMLDNIFKPLFKSLWTPHRIQSYVPSDGGWSGHGG